MFRMLMASVVTVVLTGLLGCSKPDFSPNPAYHSTRFPETRSMNEAKLWLYWSKAERLAFLRGFVVAYRDGAVRGCLHAFEQMPSTTAKDKNTPGSEICYREEPQFDRDVSDYEISMTSFYTAYPQDDDVPIRFLLKELASHKIPAEIHTELSPREH